MYTGSAVDIFNIGIILFTMVTKRFPFDNATDKDKYYKLLVNNSPDKFWDAHIYEVPAIARLSDPLRQLITALLDKNPIRRPSISEILRHEWMQGITPSDADVVEALK